MLSVDDGGRLKYWRTNYELLKDERAHQEGACAVSLAPSDLKFATCSNDSTVKVPLKQHLLLLVAQSSGQTLPCAS